MAKTGRIFDGFWPKSVVDWTAFALVAIFRETGVGKRVWLFLLWRRDLEKENEFWLLLVLKNWHVCPNQWASPRHRGAFEHSSLAFNAF